MMFTLMMFFLTASDVQWQFEKTNIFAPLSSDRAVLGDRGESYLLDSREALITQIDADGNQVRQFGGKGQGPGEFLKPFQMFFFDGKLYVIDRNDKVITVFTGDGKFIDRFSQLSRDDEVIKTSEGWVYSNWSNIDLEKAPEVFWTKERFTDQQSLFPIEGKFYHRQLTVINQDERILFSPVSNKPLMLASPDRQRVYICEVLDIDIHVVDVPGKRVVKTFKKKHRRVPFDEEWAEKMLEEVSEYMPPERRSKIVKNYPETFPAVRNALLDPNGNLVLDLWRGRPDENRQIMTLDPEGREVPSEYDWSLLSRIIGRFEDDVFLTTFDSKSEEAGIAKVALAQLKEYAANHP